MSNFFDQFDDDNAVDQKKKPASAGNFFDQFDSQPVLGDGADFSNVRSAVSTVSGAPNQNGVIDDVAIALRTGAGRVTQGVLSAPVALANLLIDPVPARAVRWAGEKLGIKNEHSDKTALGLLTGQNYLRQPDAVLGTVSEIDRAIQEDFDESASSYTKQKAAEYDQTEGFVDTLKFMAQNPRYTLATLGAEQVPQFAMPIAPGGAKATLALQGLSAGGQAASEVESDLREKGYSEDEIASRASGAVLGSAAANILPAAVLGRFGGMAFERAIGGELGEGVARGIGDRALIAGRSVLGETASNIVEETADQAVQNWAADEPIMRGLGKAAAMGGLMGAGTGSVAGLVDAVGARRIDPEPNQQVTTGAQLAADPAVAPEDGGDLDAMLEPLLAAAAQNPEAAADAIGSLIGGVRGVAQIENGWPAGPSIDDGANSVADGDAPDGGGDIGEQDAPTSSERLVSSEDAGDISGALLSRWDSDPESVIQEYASLVDSKGNSATDNGRLLDTDMFRELSPDYRANRKLSGSIHRAASRIIKERYRKMLSEPVAPGRESSVLFMAGGGGSGKSTASKAALGSINSDIIVDGTFSNYDRAKSDIDLALKHRDGVKVAFTYRPPDLAFASAMRRSAKPNARTVPNWALAEAHANAAGVVKRLAKKYAGDSRVEFVAIDNSGDDPNLAHRVEIDSIPEVPSEQELKDIFDRAAAAALDGGYISEGNYQAIIEPKPVRGQDGGVSQERSAREERDPVISGSTENQDSDGTDAIRESITRSLGDAASRVQVVRSESYLPARLRNQIARNREQRGGDGSTAGVYDTRTGKAYIISNNIRDVDHAVFVAAHEIVGHHGLRALLGDQLKPVLKLADQNPTVSKIADAITAERNLRKGQRDLAVEEALAELAAAVQTGDYSSVESRYGQPIPKPMRERVEAAIRNIVRQLKRALSGAGMKFSDKQVAQLLAAARDAARSDGVDSNDADADVALESVEDQTQARSHFAGMTREQFLGKPKITSNANAADLVPRARAELSDVEAVPFAAGEGLTAKYSPHSSAVFDGDKVVASYNDGSTLVVDKKYRRQGIAEELVYQWRSRNPSAKPATTRTKASQALQEKVWKRIERERANASILESTNEERLQDRREQSSSRREQAASSLGVSRGTPGWNYDFNRYEGVRGSLKRARLKVQDKMKSWDDVQKDIESQTGTLIDDMANVYQLENLMHGKVSTGIERIEQNQVKPLLDAMKKAGVSVETLEEYLYARHAEERNREIASINPKMPDGGSGMSTADARAILASADKAKLEPLAKMVDEITTSTRKRLLDHGLITQDQYDAMQGQYAAYVPLRGKKSKVGHFDADLRNAGAPGGRGVDSRGKPIQSALGRSTRAENILGEIIGDAQRSVILAEKARVGRGLMRLVLTHPNPSLWTLEPVQTQRKLNSEGEVYEAVVNDLSDPSIIAVRHKGQLFRVKVENPELARALNLVGVDQLNSVFRAMGSVQRYFAAVLTKYNPAFIGANATRDAIFGLTGLAAEHGERTAAKAAMNYPHALRSAWRLANGKLGDSQMDVYAKEFADTGGRTGFVAMPSVEDLAREVNSVTMGGKWARTKRGVKLVADTIGAANDSVENALRLSAYATLRQDGVSRDKAATYAKNLTVNFNRKGEYGSHIGAAILFFNASIQGSHRFAVVMSKPKAWAYVGTMVGAQAALAMMAMGMVDDDDGEPLWNKIPKHVKERNLVIPIDESHYMTVPIPYGFNVMVYAGGEAVSQIMNSQRNDSSISGTAGDYAANVASALVGAFSPVPVDTGVRTLVPTQLGGIAYDIAQNRTSLGSRIRSENPNDSRPRAVIGKPDTLEIFKVTAKAINRIGGGDDYTKPKFAWADRAPEDLEYIAEQLAGGAGKFIIDTATLGFKAADPGARSNITLKNVPILNRYASTMDELSVQRSMYFERKDSIEESRRRVRSMYARDPANAETYMQSLPGMAGARFARRKRSGKNGPAGGVIEINGSPKIVAVPGTAYDAFKKADAAFKARQETVKGAYADVPSWGIPTKETRTRDAEVRKADQELATAMTAFTKAWNDESAKAIQ